VPFESLSFPPDSPKAADVVRIVVRP
jgi:hypothetical protein